jgi:hypothetical protein
LIGSVGRQLCRNIDLPGTFLTMDDAKDEIVAAIIAICLSGFLTFLLWAIVDQI